LGQVRQEIDRRLAEKEEEFNNSRFPSQLYILTCPKTNLSKKVSYKFPSVPHRFSFVNVLDTSFELAFPFFICTVLPNKSLGDAATFQKYLFIIFKNRAAKQKPICIIYM